LAYGVCFELFGGAGRRVRRWWGVAALGLLGFGYLLMYRGLGHGAGGTGMYLDPLADPLYFLGEAAGRIPALLAGALWALPPDLWPVLPSLRPVQVVLGIVGAGGLAWLLWRSPFAVGPSESRTVGWLAGGAILTLVPAISAFPSDRQLLAPMIGGAVCLAALLVGAWRTLRQSAGWPRKWASRLVLGALGVIHLVVAPVSRVASLYGMWSYNRGLVEVVQTMPEAWQGADSGSQEPRPVLLVCAPDAFSAIYVPALYDYYRSPGEMAWQVLSLAPHGHRLRRSDARTLELEVVDGPMLATFFERVFLAPGEELAVGQVVRRELFSAEILARNEQGPTRIAFHFDTDLEAIGPLLLIWDEDGLRRVPLPPEGSAIEVPRTRLRGL